MTGTSFSCGACKFLRRKCTSECAFTPYFSYCEGADHFAAVHKVFGASNVSKLLMKVPLKNRSEAAFSISYEALARMHDPIYGCVAQIITLEEQVASLQEELDQLGTYLAYASFGQSDYISLQEINDPNAALPFYFQLSDTDILDQQTPPLSSELQASCFLHGSECQIAHSCNFLDQPVTGNHCTVLNTEYQSLQFHEEPLGI